MTCYNMIIFVLWNICYLLYQYISIEQILCQQGRLHIHPRICTVKINFFSDLVINVLYTFNRVLKFYYMSFLGTPKIIIQEGWLQQFFLSTRLCQHGGNVLSIFTYLLQKSSGRPFNKYLKMCVRYWLAYVADGYYHDKIEWQWTKCYIMKLKYSDSLSPFFIGEEDAHHDMCIILSLLYHWY